MAARARTLTRNLHRYIPAIALRTWTQNLLETTLQSPFFGMAGPLPPRGYPHNIVLRTFTNVRLLIPEYLDFLGHVRRAERTTAKVATRSDIARAERTTAKSATRVDE